MKVNPIAPNMTEVELTLNNGKEAHVLFSYKTPVACRILDNGVKFYRTEKKWSSTTSRHINKWLGEFGGPASCNPEVMPQSFFDNLENNPMEG